MASYPPPPFNNDWRTQRRILRDQARLQLLQIRGARRSSIVGPLLVISIGVLFLLVQVGRFPMATLLLSFARWWPLLLVAVGVVRLVEWFFDQRGRADAPTGAFYPQRGLGVGVGLLLTLLVIVGVASSLSRQHAERIFGREFQFNQDNLDEFFGDKHESTETLTESCPPGSVIVITNPHGNVVVSGTSDDGQLHASISHEIYTRSDTDAARKAQQLAARIDRSGNTLNLIVPAAEGARTNLAITIPADAAVNSTVNRGDIQVHSLRGSVNVTANHGDIELSGITGDITSHINNGDSSFSAHSVTGNITLEGRSLDLTLSDITGTVSLNGEFFGTTHLERVAGPVQFHTSRTDMQFARLEGELEMTPNADLTADQIVGPLVLNTRNRNITLERVSGALSVTNRNGSITVTAAAPLGDIMIENRSGAVDLTLPNDAQFSIQAQTSNADLSNDFGLPNSGSEGRPSFSGAIGKGGPSLQLTTSQADLAVHRGSIAPLPPIPPAPPRLTNLPPGAEKSSLNNTYPSPSSQSDVTATGKRTRSAAQASKQISTSAPQ